MVMLPTIAAEEGLVPCAVCQDGSAVRFPENVMDIEGVPGPFSCGQLDNLIPVMFQDNTHPDCQSLQSIGSLCGCPTPRPECTLCRYGADPLAPKQSLPFFADFVNVPGTTFEIIPDCESTDAYMRTMLPWDSALCISAQQYLAKYCQCPYQDTEAQSEAESSPCSLCNDGSSVTKPDQSLGIQDFPFQNCGHLEVGAAALFETDSENCKLLQGLGAVCGCPPRENHCQFCQDGSMVAYPEKPVPFLAEEFQGFVPTCLAFESFTQSLDSDDEICSHIQLLSSFCGCPPVENSCRAYDGEELQPEFSDKEYAMEMIELWHMDDLPFSITCEIVVEIPSQIRNDDIRCFMLKTRGDYCGFNDGEMIYGGASNKAEKLAVTWLPRVSGCLSLVGCIAILLDVLSQKKRREQIYNQIMAAMSLFDAVASMGWIASTAANPKDDLWPIDSEYGNEATCKLQAFCLSLSVVSIMYNVSLMIYYYETIVLAWRGDHLKAGRKYLHILPAAFLVISFVGLPFYGTVFMFCHVQVPPMVDSWLPQLLLHNVPVALAIIACTILILLIWIKVHQQVKLIETRQVESDEEGEEEATRSGKGRRETFLFSSTIFSFPTIRNCSRSRGSHSVLSPMQKVEREVLWQAFLYTIAFYISWIPTFFHIWRRGVAFRLTCITLFLVPLQGALNSLNYFRPRLESMLVRGIETFKSQFSERNDIDFNRAAGHECDDGSTEQVPRIENHCHDVDGCIAILEGSLDEGRMLSATEKSQDRPRLGSIPEDRSIILGSSSNMISTINQD